LPLASSLERDSCASTALGDIIDRSLNAAVDGLSPGPLKTRAASGIDHFDELIEKACARAPERRLVAIEDVGAMATDLVSDFARNVTGNVAYIDAGYHVMS
jgi:enoyl-[acyl-carrier protein] reductase I